ncbi:hypothetical protein PITCH_A830022 [uncultured Desulfobacterium sp.]|uniref:Uncharacterized protein n=1 Tax=uncultured Desulfobacterium sp. TaxID=201089 RepID=A0A445N343_9BACT|nr:hypothetical protein PITCH_A830022 [uncultured Desulfobacterium sp.]
MKKRLFNLFGTLIVLLGFILIGLLSKKSNYADNHTPEMLSSETAEIASAPSDWMEIYLNDEKVGYSANQISPVQEDYLVEEEIVLSLNLMGKPGIVNSVTRCVVGHQFQLKSFTFKMTSDAVQFRVSGNVEKGRLVIETGEGKERRTESVELTETPMVAPVITHFFKNRHIEVGQSFSFPILDPSTMAKETMTAKIAGKDLEPI